MEWIKKVPHVLTILFIIFISLFSFDVFWEGYVWYVAIGAFLIHMIPSFALTGIYLYTRKNEKVGGWIFIVLGIIFTFWFNTYREIIGFLLISFPAFVIGGLFLYSNYLNKKRGKKWQRKNKKRKVKTG